MAERTKARICGHSLAEFTGSNPGWGRMFLSCGCCVRARTDLCDGPIPRPEDSYRLWFVIVCDLETARMRRSWPALGCCTRERKVLWVEN